MFSVIHLYENVKEILRNRKKRFRNNTYICHSLCIYYIDRKGGNHMQQEENRKNQEIISIEEYLYKRKKIKEQEERHLSPYKISIKEKSSALVLAELYM